jgi:hypothetical protein
VKILNGTLVMTASGTVLSVLIVVAATAPRVAAIVEVGPGLQPYYDVCVGSFAKDGTRDLLDQLEKSKNVFMIRKSDRANYSDRESVENSRDGTGTGGTIHWDPTDTHVLSDGVPLDSCATLYHEMSHLNDFDKGIDSKDVCRFMKDGKEEDSGIPAAEVKATRKENEYRRKESEYRATLSPPSPKLEVRTHYERFDKSRPLPPDGAECQPRPPEPPPPHGCSVGCAIGAGDPHLKTFDDFSYDFQAVGEFVLARASAGDLEVQGRMIAASGLRTVSLFSAVAANVAGDRVGVYRSPDGLRIHIGGTAIHIPPRIRQLPRGGVVEVFSDELLDSRWPDGSLLRIRTVGAYSISLSLYLAQTRRSQVEGLFGNFNGKREDDLIVHNGTTIGDKPSFDTLYRTYGDSWRVTQARSLFDYGTGENTETFTDRSFPDKPVLVSDLQNRGSAEAICRKLGVTAAKQLENCILDVALTGEIPFAHDAADVQANLVQAQTATTYRDSFGGTVVFPLGDLSFADEVVSFHMGDPHAALQHSDPRNALGPPDYDGKTERNYTTLGCGGVLTLRFLDNVLIDVPGPDLYVFEIGPQLEATRLEISADGKQWIDIGRIPGGTAGVDIGPYVKQGEVFHYVRLTDLREACQGEFPGADIDAVGAIGLLRR